MSKQKEILQSQIDQARAEIKTDGYAQSISEWISLYEQNEIHISPAFQRFFRWTLEQKSNLIESILLGIPIPPIFVAQRKDNVWEVIDGLQRLSTIYEFVGVLKDKDGNYKPPLELASTKYLPSLEGTFWEQLDENGKETENSLNSDQRLLIKRSKIGVSILLTADDGKSKYELFQRLNTGGSALSDQEVRNAIMVMLDEEFFNKVSDMAEYGPFKECVSITENSISQRYDLELVTRFIVLKNASEEELSTVGDLNQYLTDRLVDIINNKELDIDKEANEFRATFDALSEDLGSDSMKRWNSKKGRFEGGFVISAFEIVALGVAYNIDCIDKIKGQLREMTQKLWEKEQFTSSGGVRASTRIPQTITLGRTFYTCE